MSVASIATFCLVEFFDNGEFHLLMTSHNHLSYAFSWIDYEWLLREIDEQCHQFATVICIHCAWSIEHCDAILQCKTAAWTYLCLIAYRQSDVQSCRNQTALQWLKRDWFGDICTQIHACALWSGVLWERLRTFIYYFYL